MSREERRGIFQHMLAFARSADVAYKWFAVYSSKTEFVPEVTPEKYRLFQAADLACTLALVRTKLEVEGKMTLSEKVFFGGEKFLRKVYLKPLERKEWR